MTIDTADLGKWLAKRPKWLQDVARRLFQAGDLTNNDVTELLVLCKREAGIPVDGHQQLTSQPIPATAFAATPAPNSLTLESLSHVMGINRLSPRTPLRFGDEALTLIYGSNGAGKSGYIRILKHICGGKGVKPLHSNIFDASPTEQCCTVRYTLGDDTRQIVWKPPDGMCSDLLRYFRKLVETCEALDSQ